MGINRLNRKIGKINHKPTMKRETLLNRRLLILLLLSGFQISLFAKSVSETTAELVGKNFIVQSTTININEPLSLVYKAMPQSNSNSFKTSPPPDFYIFNFSNGFVIVAGDDRITPILGYSNEGIFRTNNISPEVKYLLDGYSSQIESVINKNAVAVTSTSEKWDNLINTNNGPASGPQSTKSGVSPLLSTIWNQSPYYNNDCPYDNNASAYCVTGCVATAMAQVLKYWDYPKIGSGFHSYKSNSYGTLSADFGNTRYGWSSMPNEVTSTNNSVATLMYHCGVSVEMNYGVNESSAYVIAADNSVCAENALKTNFSYSSTLQGLKRSNYSDATWISKLESELDNGRPVIYAGQGTSGGHCFVFDGYDVNDNFHVNWGWDGYYDGYFAISSLDPTGQGTGGGSGNYNSYQEAIIGIEPPKDTATSSSSMELYDYLTPSASSIGYDQSFSVTYNVENAGKNDFSGDFCAAIFDSNLTFVNYIQILSAEKLPSGDVYKNDLKFSTSGILGMLPGKYYIYAYYRSTGGNWVALTGNGSYVNSASISVTNTNDYALYAPLKVSGGNTIVSGNSVSVQTNFANLDQTNSFNGTIDLSLYTIDSGKFIARVEQKTGESLSANSYFSQGLTFSNSALVAPPGTYLLALLAQPSGSGSWYICGSQYYQNPIEVIVKAAALLADKYEPNNTESTAYNLPFSFSGNNASINTVGSNCNTGTDYDFYSISLASGYSYSISARMDDANESFNGNTYTLNGIYSYSTDGVTWNGPYTGALANNIAVNNGGTVYFEVAPSFSGETGTYLLEISGTRSAISGIDNLQMTDEVRIYPNPAKDRVTIDMTGFSGKIQKVSMVNMQGQEVFVLNTVSGGKVIPIDTQGLPQGIYYIQIQTDNGIINKMITVQK